MGKLLKVFGWILGIVVLLVIAAVLILPQVIDPNDYKQEIVSKVREQTGRELQIDGRIDLSVFPWLGVETGAIRLGNGEGFSGDTFAAVKEVAVRVKLMPLLSRRLEADTVALKGLRLNLARNRDGRGNWEDLAARPGTAGAAASGGETGAGRQHGGAGLAALSIGGIDISDAEIRWDDQRSGQQLQLTQLQLESGAVQTGRPVDLALKGRLEANQPALQAELDLKGVVALDEAAGVVDVSDLRVQLDASGETLPGGKLSALLQAAIAAALDGSRVEIKGLRLSAAELDLSGELQGRNLAVQPIFSGNLALAEFNLRKWLGDIGMALPAMADPKALTRVGAKLQLSTEGSTTRIDNIVARLDDTRIDGSASLRAGAIGFNLNLDAIDVDRYLPPTQADAPSAGAAPAAKPTAPANGAQNAAAKPAAPANGAQGATAEAPLYPLETLRALNLDGVLNIGRLTVNKLLAEELQLKVKARDGKLSLKQQIRKFYQGGYQGEAVIDSAGKSPRTLINAKATGIQIGPLLKDLSGQDRLIGKGGFSANLNTSGNTLGAVKRTLGGEFDFRFEDGAVKGFNLAQTVRDAKARLSGQPVVKSDEPLQTDFSELTASGSISKGVISNQDLLAKSPYLRVEGAGKVNIVAEDLDYKVRAVVVKSAKGQGGEGLKELEGVTIPVHLTGAYARPSVTIDWDKVLLESQKEKVKEKIREKLGDKLEKKLPSGLQDKLKGLFN